MDEHKFLNVFLRGLLTSALLFVPTIPFELCAAHPYEHFVGFCSIGVRAPGTPGHRAARDFIMKNLDRPQVDSFVVNGVDYFNIYARFGTVEPRIGFAAHWDSDIGCPGANDGGSGVALLLGLADTLAKNKPRQAVDLLFFDGEDVEGAELLGSKHFATNCVDRYEYIIVFDMIGDSDLQLYQEGNSAKFFPEFVDSIWDIGSALAPYVFVPAVKYYIIDDHMSLIAYGIRAIDIIDFDYPYWDTADDTMDKCRRESLDLMYRFVLDLVYQQAKY
jgi:glutaminyl-peptide cyclotransferase